MIGLRSFMPVDPEDCIADLLGSALGVCRPLRGRHRRRARQHADLRARRPVLAAAEAPEQRSPPIAVSRLPGSSSTRGSARMGGNLSGELPIDRPDEASKLRQPARPSARLESAPRAQVSDSGPVERTLSPTEPRPRARGRKVFRPFLQGSRSRCKRGSRGANAVIEQLAQRRQAFTVTAAAAALPPCMERRSTPSTS